VYHREGNCFMNELDRLGWADAVGQPWVSVTERGEKGSLKTNNRNGKGKRAQEERASTTTPRRGKDYDRREKESCPKGRKKKGIPYQKTLPN